MLTAFLFASLVAMAQDPESEIQPTQRNTETGVRRQEIPGTLRRTNPDSELRVLGGQDETSNERNLSTDTVTVISPAVLPPDDHSTIINDYPKRRQADTLESLPVAPRETDQ